MGREKRDNYPFTIRLTQKEDAWFRDACSRVEMDMSVAGRKSLFHGMLLLLGNRNCRRVEFEDLITDKDCR